MIYLRSNATPYQLYTSESGLLEYGQITGCSIALCVMLCFEGSCSQLQKDLALSFMLIFLAIRQAFVLQVYCSLHPGTGFHKSHCTVVLELSVVEYSASLLGCHLPKNKICSYFSTQLVLPSPAHTGSLIFGLVCIMGCS